MRARDNPFAAERMHAIRYLPMGWTWEEMLARLATMRNRAAVVGPHGTGKTTFLAGLARQLRERGWHCRSIMLRSDDRRIPLTEGLGESDIVIVDGAEQLSPLAWRRLIWKTRRAGGLIISSHAPGRLPTLLRTAATAEILQHVLRELSIDPAGIECEALLRQHGGNVRDLLRELYDRAAAQLVH